MFICNECLKKKFTNGDTMFKSHGSCESCGKHSACNDIPSKWLVPKLKKLKEKK